MEHIYLAITEQIEAMFGQTKDEFGEEYKDVYRVEISNICFELENILSNKPFKEMNDKELAPIFLYVFWGCFEDSIQLDLSIYEAIAKKIKGGINNMTMTLDEILDKRNSYTTEEEEWDVWNDKKAELLEQLKPSTKERIVYFLAEDLQSLPDGFVPASDVPTNLDMRVSKRSLLEYNPLQRHPIPYAIVKHKKRYFFILRESGSGELRLIGKKGLLGGHVGEEDLDTLSLSKTCLNGLFRELGEEAGITHNIVEKIDFKGYIKGTEGVDTDHLGMVYQIELMTDDIESQEEGILKGIWLHEDEIEGQLPYLESWAHMLAINVILNK